MNAQKKNNYEARSIPPEKINFVYPYGCSLNIQRPSRPIFSSGTTSYPLNRPIAAIWESDTVNEIGGKRGKLIVIGSAEVFGDDWIDKEINSQLSELLFGWSLNDVELDMVSNRQDSELLDYTAIPNVDVLSKDIRPCLQGMDDLPSDFSKLFDVTMFKFDVDLIPRVTKSFNVLGLNHDPLTLIPPQFESPLPKLIPAVFAPSMREPVMPSLDQFDLDESFANEDIRLAQLCNKCTQKDEDMEYFISEAGEIMGMIIIIGSYTYSLIHDHDI